MPVTVILIRDKSKTGFDLALVTTEKDPDPARVIERYAARWAIEVAIEDAKQLVGVGQAHNRKALAVERTVPFGLLCHSILTLWYALHGHDHDDTRLIDGLEAATRDGVSAAAARGTVVTDR